jgi:alpha-1,3-rhamnosyl/mannosyltransferase
MPIGIDLRPFQDPIARGVSSYAHPLISELLRQNSTEDFIGFAAGRRTVPEIGLKTKKISLPSKFTNSAFAFLRKPEIDHYLGVESFWMPNQNYWSVSASCRLTLTVHDLSFLVEPNWYSAKERLWHRLIGAVELVRRADRIMTLSRHTARELEDVLKIPAEKISVIPPGVPPLQENETAALPYPYVLFVGVVEPRKNVATAIAAFDMLAETNKDVHFVIAGHRSGRPAPKMRYPERVHLLGQVAPQEKTGLMKNARALFFPSLYEGFGFPALEAMSLGVPVVASSAGALPETVGDAGILLDPYDAYGFSRALAEVCDDKAWRETLIARGRERAKLFSWEKCAQDTLKILRNA